MSASYPTTVKTWTPVVDSVDDIMAQDINDLYDEVIAIETNLNSTKYPTSTKTAPIDADSVLLVDSEATNVLKRLTWAYVKSVLNTYFLSNTQTLTNKTLTTPKITSIKTPTNTLTLPTSTDTVVGRATIDTLTNKTLTSPKLNEDVALTVTATTLNGLPDIVSTKSPSASPTFTGTVVLPSTTTINAYTPYTFGNITLTTTSPSSALADGVQVQVY